MKKKKKNRLRSTEFLPRFTFIRIKKDNRKGISFKSTFGRKVDEFSGSDATCGVLFVRRATADN